MKIVVSATGCSMSAKVYDTKSMLPRTLIVLRFSAGSVFRCQHLAPRLTDTLCETSPGLNSKSIKCRILQRRTVSIEHSTSNFQCGFALLNGADLVFACDWVNSSPHFAAPKTPGKASRLFRRKEIRRGKADEPCKEPDAVQDPMVKITFEFWN